MKQVSFMRVTLRVTPESHNTVMLPEEPPKKPPNHRIFDFRVGKKLYITMAQKTLHNYVRAKYFT